MFPDLAAPTMYTHYFDLKERPFSISPDPRFLFLTAQHQEALAKCQYAIAERMGISAIYGNMPPIPPAASPCSCIPITRRPFNC
jgi:hypothetical protein